MMSTSTPDLRDDDSRPPPATATVPGKMRLAGGGVPRPSSAPATVFIGGDSAFQKIGDDEDDCTSDFGEILNVLSIEEDAERVEVEDPCLVPEHGRSMAIIPEHGRSMVADDVLDKIWTDSPNTINTDLNDNFAADVIEKAVVVQSSPVPSNSNQQPIPVIKKILPANPTRTRDFRKPRPLTKSHLRVPLVVISDSDNTTSDESEQELFVVAMRRNSGGENYRRRHSLATIAPDQITRLLLSQRGSRTSLTLSEEGIQKIDNDSCMENMRSSLDRRKSADEKNVSIIRPFSRGDRKPHYYHSNSPAKVVSSTPNSSNQLRIATSERVKTPPSPRYDGRMSPDRSSSSRPSSPTPRSILSLARSVSPTGRARPRYLPPREEGNTTSSTSVPTSPTLRVSSSHEEHHSQPPSCSPSKPSRSPRSSTNLEVRRSSLRGSSFETSDPNAVRIRHNRSPMRGASLAADDSDDNFQQERAAAFDHRRLRRGSRGMIASALSGGMQAEPPGSRPTGRQSRRSSIAIAVPNRDEEAPSVSQAERDEIAAKHSKRRGRRSSWAGAGQLPLFVKPVSASSLLRQSGNWIAEETEQTSDVNALTLHFITNPGQSQPLRKILRPLLDTIAPKLTLFNFVERSESAARTASERPGSRDGSGGDQPGPKVPTLGVVLLLQEESGMERILEAQKYLKTAPWELHHQGKVGENKVTVPTNNQDFYAHQTWEDSALWAVRQVHFGRDRLRFQLFVSDEMWSESVRFYSTVLNRSTHIKKADFCYFLVFCSNDLNLDVELALKKLSPGCKPSILESAILQFKIDDADQLLPKLPRAYVAISERRWRTADPDGNKVLLLIKDGDACSSTSATPTCPISSESRPSHYAADAQKASAPVAPVMPHKVNGYFDERMQESNMVSAV